MRKISTPYFASFTHSAMIHILVGIFPFSDLLRHVSANKSSYAHYVFSLLDVKERGFIDFEVYC